jgi:N-acyl homoserine lactone hydrolase
MGKPPPGEQPIRKSLGRCEGERADDPSQPIVYRIRAIENATCAVPGSVAFEGGDPGEVHPYSLYIWLIEGGERPVLVDTGIKDCAEMNRHAGRVLAEPMVQQPGQDTTSTLRALGVEPAEVGCVFLTHLHYDHMSNLDLFPNATIVVARRGFDQVFAEPPEWIDRARLIDDEEMLPGIRAFWVGGHTHSSIAVAVRTAIGTAVIAGDVVSLYANLERDIPVAVHDDLEECRRAMGKIRRAGDFVLPSHDPEVMQRYPGGIIG